MRVTDIAKRDDRGGAGDDDACVAESDEGDEEADASSDGGMKLMGDSGDETLAETGEGEGEKDDPGEEDSAESALPGNAHLEADGIGEVCVEAHAGCEGKGIVGECSHENAPEGRTEAGGGGDCGEGHAGFGEDGRVHEDDVGHRDEGGEAGEDLGAPVGLEAAEAEVVFESMANGQRMAR